MRDFCTDLTIDIRDAVGDRLHISDSEFQKDGTTFEIGHAGRIDSIPQRDLSVGGTISASKKKNAKSMFQKEGKSAGPHQASFSRTAHIVPDGPACRIFGSMNAKKVTGNLHITTLGHGYWSWEHTDHSLMNLSHVIHEFSFGPYFPQISQPLDASVETSNEHFAVFQYFVSIVPTTFIDAWGRRLNTNQYSVNDYTRTVEHGMGVPGIFIKYDVEPLTMTIRERTTSLTQFLVRLAGILGGVWVCAGFGLRVGDRIVRIAGKTMGGGEQDASPEQYAASYSSAYARPSASSGLMGISTRGGSSYATPRWMDGSSSSSSSSGFMNGVRDKTASAFGSLTGGPSHRHTESMQQKIFSEEGRAW